MWSATTLSSLLWEVAGARSPPSSLSLLRTAAPSLPLTSTSTRGEGEVYTPFLLQSPTSSTAATLADAGLVLLTDGVAEEEREEEVECPPGFLPCLGTPGCHPEEGGCGGHCPGALEEEGCGAATPPPALTRSLTSTMFQSMGRRVRVTSRVPATGLGETWVQEVGRREEVEVRVVTVKHARLGEEVGLRVVVRGRRSGVVRVQLPPSPHYTEVRESKVEVEVEEEGEWHRVVRMAVRLLRVGRVTVRVEVEVGGRSTRGGAEVEVEERGRAATLHSSLQLGLGHHSYSRQAFLVPPLGTNTVQVVPSSSSSSPSSPSSSSSSSSSSQVMVAGDRLGPPLPPPPHPSINCEESAARLASLLTHTSYLEAVRREVPRRWEEEAATCHQELLSCQLPSGAFTFHFHSSVASVWVTSVAAGALARAGRGAAGRRGAGAGQGSLGAALAWLLRRQGEEGEWGEDAMFPDLDQVVHHNTIHQALFTLEHLLLFKWTIDIKKHVKRSTFILRP